MTSGQTALSLTDLPFMYSFLNVMTIILFGIPENYESRFIIIGIFAGIGGTFLIFWHPIQYLIDWYMTKSYEKLSTYYVSSPTQKPKAYDILINNDQFRLSLKSSSIKYLKDKYASLIYFIIILVSVGVAVVGEDVQKLLNIQDPFLIIPIFAVLTAMAFALGFFNRTLYVKIRKGLQLESLYYQVTKLPGYQEEREEIRRSIDLQEWEIVESQLKSFMRRHWGAMKQWAEEEHDELK